MRRPDNSWPSLEPVERSFHCIVEQWHRSPTSARRPCCSDRHWALHWRDDPALEKPAWETRWWNRRTCPWTNRLLSQSMSKQQRLFHLIPWCCPTSVRSLSVWTAEEQSTQVMAASMLLKNCKVTLVFSKSFESMPGRTERSNGKTYVWLWGNVTVGETISGMMKIRQNRIDVKRCGSVRLSTEANNLRTNEDISCIAAIERTNCSITGGTSSSERSMAKARSALLASSREVLLNIAMNTHSFRQWTNSVISSSVNREDGAGLKYQRRSDLLSLPSTRWSAQIDGEDRLTDGLVGRIAQLADGESERDWTENHRCSMDGRSFWLP